MALEFSNLDEIKVFFQIEDDSIDELLQTLIKHYSEVIIDKTKITTQNIKAKEALFFAIGCHLLKLNLGDVSQTISYTAKEVQEEFQPLQSPRDTWCQLYRDKLDEISAEINKTTFGVKGIKRKGLSDLNEFQ